METITLRKNGQFWLAKFSHTDTTKLFGTDEIQTPFPATMVGLDVARRLAALNSDCRVIIADE